MVNANRAAPQCDSAAPGPAGIQREAYPLPTMATYTANHTPPAPPTAIRRRASQPSTSPHNPAIPALTGLTKLINAGQHPHRLTTQDLTP